MSAQPKSQRVFNFSAGPAMLPLEVLEASAKALVDFQGKGFGIAECSHRGKEFDGVMDEAPTNQVLPVSTLMLPPTKPPEATWSEGRTRTVSPNDLSPPAAKLVRIEAAGVEIPKPLRAPV